MKSLSEFLAENTLESLSAWDFQPAGTFYLSGVPLSAAAMTVASRFLKNPRHTLVVVKDYRQGELWVENLESMIGEDSVCFFPSLGLKPYERKRPFDGVIEERLSFFQKVSGNMPLVVVTPVDSLLMRLPPPETLARKVRRFQVGDIYEPAYLRKTLLDMGYAEEPVVGAVGEFSLRGCILDINSFLYPHPLRIEFFGDEIESIRAFDIFSQRSIEKHQSVEIYPMGEFTPTLSEKENYPVQDPDLLWWCRSEFEDLSASLLDYLPNANLVFEELAALSEYASRYRSLCDTAFLTAKEWGILVPPEKIWWNFSELSPRFSGVPVLNLTQAVTEVPRARNLVSRPQALTGSGTQAVVQEVEEFVNEGGRVYLVASTLGTAQRLRHFFEDVPLEEILIGNLIEGFWLPEEGIAFLSEARIFNRHSRRGRKKGVSGSVASALLIESLSRGDYVVHEDHGVGRYLGLVRVEVNGGIVDCALLEYAGGDRLKFPVSDLQKIERLQNSEEHTPALNKLGSKIWENVKSRVKKRVIQIARELVELYAKREIIEGFAFPPDSKLQEEFEAAFEYEPTPDQIRAIAEIKTDMQTPKPMDRLVCGDVGFGKTEVAMRAAFKCVLAKKQVAILVPTTILAAQHYETFQERFAAFPVNIALVNRYRTAVEKKEVFKELSEGKIDIVIGTHSLISDKNHFKDLGLLIIDEEQKFGVKQKEKLREMRLTVDTLSMSATPIPRSLHLSLAGVRDISLINTPPVNRLPVETKLLRRDDTILAQAVKDELVRGGQVFVVTDRVQGIENLAMEVENFTPEARVAVAHGQMEDRELERTMNAFLAGEFDVLVSTSIIESGIDVPRANTIIIMNAHHFGISQLYQMRGRVGRSHVLAYAYLVTPEKREISADSSKRLQALAQFTDLGSGYQLAMRDLEIRGAGNLLGAEQHGFIAEIGFETYVRLVREAVEAIRGISSEKPIEPRIELGIDAYLPEDWIEDGLSRISVYQRIARLNSQEEIESIREELRDRFGPIPEAAEHLLTVTEIGMIAGRLRIQGLQQRKGILAVTFTETPPPDPRKLAEILALSPYPMRYLGSSPLQAIIELGVGDANKLVAKVLETFRAFRGLI
ncbi:MAG: transcription-repair coupling factor [Fibrobacter sp.]|jgi:transcription-repair coupling factor (superfamily II helicase)|nr:transcription-repair coupling factor [Fibrobacter sp.]